MEDDRELLREVMEDEGYVVEVGSGDGWERRGSTVECGNERNNGKGEEEGGKGASLFEAISDDDDKIGVMKREDDMFGIAIKILEGTNDVRWASEEFKKVPEIGTAEGREGIVHIEKASGRRGRGGRGV